MSADAERFLGRDVFTYTQEKERFQKDLFQFHAGRGTHFLGLPTVSGKPLDLYLLYSLVNKYGGFHKVCDRNLWWHIPQEYFNFPDVCANSELALKQIYMRYLYLYERVNVHGDDPDHPDDDDSGTRGAKSSRILVHQVPVRYNYRQHRVRPSDRAHLGFSTNLARPNEYERLEKSLLSGLPNEVDFAINVCCILSMEGSSALKLLSHPHLIHLLLAHVGLFTDNTVLQDLYHSEWFPRSRRNFTQFWYEYLQYEDLDYGSALMDMISCAEQRQQDQNYYLTKRLLTASNLLHLDRDDKDPVFYRIKQVSHIVRNLSFDSLNAKVMAESCVTFNFAMLCCHNTHSELKRSGMDILENISKLYIIPAIHESSTQLIIRCLHKWINSKDKLELVSALLVMSALAKVEQNEECLIEALPQDFYCQMVSLARVYDLQLIVAALDALYYLSEIGEGPCECIALVKHSIDFLANLVTVETQSFGESALGGIIVRDHRIAPSSHLLPQAGQLSRPVGTMMGPPATPYNTRPMLRPQLTPAQPLMQQPARPQTPPSASATVVQLPPAPATPRPSVPNRQLLTRTPSHRTILPATPQNLASMSPEQVSCNWLRANYEQYPGSIAVTAKVHQEYVLWLQRRGGSAAIPVSPDAFVNCVKKVFPYSDLIVNGPESQISGMRWKAPQPAQNTPVLGQMRPQLSQPPPAYGTPHLLSPGAQGPAMPPRISSPSHTASNDMLRSMLLNETSGSRPRSNSGTSSTVSSGGRLARSSRASRGKASRSASPRAKSTADSPLPPVSPVSSMELQVCGSAEKVESFVNGASLARIERVENPLSSTTSASTPAHRSSVSSTHRAFSPSNSSINASSKPDIVADSRQNGGDMKPIDSTSSSSNNRKDGDSAMDSLNQGVTPSPHSSESNGVKGNGRAGTLSDTPSDTLCSPPTCNGHLSDSDSLVTGAGRSLFHNVNGAGDCGKPHPAKRNGIINGLEKMVADIPEQKPTLSTAHRQREARRHHSGDSLASQSSTSTQLSLSQQSAASSDQRHELNECFSIQLPPSTSIANQLPPSTPIANQLPPSTSIANRLPPSMSITNQEPPGTSIANQLPPGTSIANQLPPGMSIANQQPAQTPTINQMCAQTAAINQQTVQVTPADQVSIAANIPTVVETVSNPSVDMPPSRRLSVSKSLASSIQVSIPQGPLPSSAAAVSPATSVSPGAASSKRSRKRRRSTASTDSRQSTDSSLGQYKCLWEGCGSGFSTCPLLRKHVSQMHTAIAAACVWAGCDRVERKRWALVSHVTERHTSDAALARALSNREKGILPATTAPPPPQSPSIYTPQAAKIAILRNYPKTPFPEFTDIREGPVTKHIRFTAALILRNICRYSPAGRTLLKKHESSLAVIAGSSMEASAPVLNCLWEMQQSPHLL